MADEVLEGLQYSESVSTPMIWENSNIRDWLNGYTNYDSDSFIKQAFSEDENAEGYGYIDDESPEELYKPKESVIVNKDMYFDSIKSVTAETDGFALLLTQAQSGRGVSFYALFY